uniref:40S ribosomal protein S8 n=1 Tax=Myotis lucifugus TaxID=59463 RepID=G1Q5H9_MYOLU
DNWHNHHKTRGKRKPYHKKIYTDCMQGGNKNLAVRLDMGNFFWGSECCLCKTGIIDVVDNASNNDLVCTKTLVKNCLVLIDSTPYRQWYKSHYALRLGYKKEAKLTTEEEGILNKQTNKQTKSQRKDEREKNAHISNFLEEQFRQGKLLACFASRPDQCGHPDGCALE